jgi:hypothetical protein
MKIEITRVEGPSNLCGEKKTFTNWIDSHIWLIRQSSTFPGRNEGYDKHDFKVTFDDGETYKGRLDCKQSTEPDADLDVYRHMLDLCEWYAGLAKNPYCGKAKYDEMMKQPMYANNANEYKEFISKYLSN